MSGDVEGRGDTAGGPQDEKSRAYALADPVVPPTSGGFPPIDPSVRDQRGRRHTPWLALGAAVVVVLLVVAGAALLLATSQRGNDTVGDARGSPTASPDVAAQIRDVVAAVPAIRELEPKADVPNAFIDQQELERTLRELFEAENAPEQIAAEEALYKRLGLLPLEADLRALILELYGSQALAFYRSDTAQFYIVRRSEAFGALDRVVVAHEYTHALQDQHFDLDVFQDVDPSEGDRAQARLAVIEGDATLLMTHWAAAKLSPTDLLTLGTAAGSPADDETLARMPPILQRSLAFPYLDGMSFVSDLHRRGGWDEVDRAYADPPVSTEQILHPEKYVRGERPVAITAPDLAPNLGEGWKRSYDGTLGELVVEVWAGNGAPPATLPGAAQPGTDVAAGWGGDRVASYDGPSGAWALVWRTAWDTPADAGEFAASTKAVSARLPGVSTSRFVDEQGRLADASDRVLLLVASDAQTLATLEGALRVAGG